MKQRVLVVDDSIFIRRVISDWINSQPDMETIGTAVNGKDGFEKAIALKPDVVTLDIQMPDMDGIQTLELIMSKQPIPVLIVSSVTTEGAETTLEALDLGAYDFVTKPKGSSNFNFLGSKDDLINKIRAAKKVKLRKIIRAPQALKIEKATNNQILVVASSTGGPKALSCLLQSLPSSFPAPILIVQHMPAGFTTKFAERIHGFGNIPCKEAAAGDILQPNQIYIAPGGLHMEIKNKKEIILTSSPTLHGVRPAADLLFFSAAKQFKQDCTGVVLTGMGKDGAQGAVAIRQAGGFVIGEDESSCTVYGMPKAAKEAGGVNLELPIQNIGHYITKIMGGRTAAHATQR